MKLIKRIYDVINFSYYLARIDHAYALIAAVTRGISVIAHDEYTAVGNGLRADKIYLIARKLGDIVFLNRLAVDIDYAVIEVDIYRLPLGGDDALYEGLFRIILIFFEDDNVSCLRSIE